MESYWAELLGLAAELTYNEHPSQANLRRGISTAYYAVFHLLIEEAVSHWDVPEVRASLSRIFDHGPMKKASLEIAAKLSREETPVAEKLRTVAENFTVLQERRHLADYDLSKVISQTDATDALTLATDATAAWGDIRQERLAHEYLAALMGRKK